MAPPTRTQWDATSPRYRPVPADVLHALAGRILNVIGRHALFEPGEQPAGRLPGAPSSTQVRLDRCWAPGPALVGSLVLRSCVKLPRLWRAGKWARAGLITYRKFSRPASTAAMVPWRRQRAPAHPASHPHGPTPTSRGRWHDVDAAACDKRRRYRSGTSGFDLRVRNASTCAGTR
jgi:hypothetical protein